jgi:hypothetical protein
MIGLEVRGNPRHGLKLYTLYRHDGFAGTCMSTTNLGTYTQHGARSIAGKQRAKAGNDPKIHGIGHWQIVGPLGTEIIMPIGVK